MTETSPKDTHTIASARIAGSEFKQIASAMNLVLERRNTIPVLGEVRVEISAGKATFMATDLDMRLTMEAEAETDGRATFLIGGRKLAGMASALTGSVLISYQQPKEGALHKQRVVELSTDGLNFRSLDRIPAEDFPQMAFAGNPDWRKKANTFTATQDQLRRMLSLSRHCISTEETRYYLNGAYLTKQPEGNTLRGVSTDGHRMAIVDTPIELQEDVGILPSKLIDVLQRLMKPGANEPVSAQFQGVQLVLSLPGIELASKLIDGTFPDYTRVIPPQSRAGEVQLSKASVARFAAISNTVDAQRSQPVKLDLKAKKMSLKLLGNDEVTAPIQSSGDFDLGINIRYLADQAKVTPSFTLQAKSSGDPIRCVGDDPDALFILMPMRV